MPVRNKSYTSYNAAIVQTKVVNCNNCNGGNSANKSCCSLQTLAIAIVIQELTISVVLKMFSVD